MALKAFYKLSDFFDEVPMLYSIDWVDLNRAGEPLSWKCFEAGEVDLWIVESCWLI